MLKNDTKVKIEFKCLFEMVEFKYIIDIFFTV